jgi:hypothetical protein
MPPDEPAGTPSPGARGGMPARLARHAHDALGVVLLGSGLAILVGVFLRWPIQAFDEGVLLTGSMMVRDGRVLYRDFYSNYPPGIFWSIAALWKIFGVGPVVLRYFGLALQAGLALSAGRIVGRAGGRRFSVFGAGLVLAWLCLLSASPYAWLAGLLAALLFIERVGAGSSGSRSLAPWLSAGLALGALGVFRHDLFVYFALALLPPAAAWLVRNPHPVERREGLRRGLVLGAATVAVLSAAWIPTIARAGFDVVLGDLFLDQVRYAMPSRVLPLPDLLALRATPMGLVLPMLAWRPFEGAVALGLAGPLLCAVALVLVRQVGRRVDPGLVLLTSLSLAVLPQLLGRTDVHHALFTVTPALAAGAVIVERMVAPARRPGQLLAGLVLALLLALPVSLYFPDLLRRKAPEAFPGQPARYGGLAEASPEIWNARRSVFAFLDRHGRPGDPIFVGCIDHRFPSFSELDLYFLADRTGATRYMQFDPGLTGRREVQDRMIRDLERSRPKAVILSARTLPPEPNTSAVAGSDVLDRYLRSKYEPEGRSGPYLLLVRR